MIPNSTYTDYPFGMVMPGRSNPLNMVDADGHRYGFQGQELDDEIKGGRGTSVNYKYRMHDPRVGRFFAVDPLAKQFAWNSPYSFSENVVIHDFELEGLERGSRQVRKVSYLPSGSGRIVNTVVGYRSHMGVKFSYLRTSRPTQNLPVRPANRFEVQNSSGMNFAQATRNFGTVRRMLEQQYESTVSGLKGEIEITQLDYTRPGSQDMNVWSFSDPNDKALVDDMEAKYDRAINDFATENLKAQGFYKLDETCVPCAQKEILPETVPSEKQIESAREVAKMILGPSPKDKLKTEIENSPATVKSKTVIRQDVLQSTP